MAINFAPQRATKKSARLKMALVGVSGSGKTFTALSIAKHLVPNGRVLLIDSESGSASKYASDFEFDVLELESFHPNNYTECIFEAEKAGYDVIILDSLSHAWSGKDGAIELVDKAAKRGAGGNSFAAWRDVTPLHNALISAIVSTKIHLIATMRAKTEYVQEKDAKSGRTVIRKVGLAPVQRDQMEYEFDVVADINAEHDFIVTKTRCSAIAELVENKAGENVATILRDWLTDGVPQLGEIGTEKLASIQLVDEANWARIDAVKLGYRTEKGGEPKPLELGVSWAIAEARRDKWQEFVEAAKNAPQTIPVQNFKFCLDTLRTATVSSQGFAQFETAIDAAKLDWLNDLHVAAFEKAATEKLGFPIVAEELVENDWVEYATMIGAGELKW